MEAYRVMAEAGEASAIAALEAAPQIPAGLAAMAWLAFAQLGTERQIGMGPGPIPWSKVRDWALDNGLETPDERDDLAAVVAHLDGLWLKHAAGKATNPPTGGKPVKPKTP